MITGYTMMKVRCKICTHSWYAVSPAKTKELECPNCGRMTMPIFMIDVIRQLQKVKDRIGIHLLVELGASVNVKYITAAHDTLNDLGFKTPLIQRPVHNG